MGPIFPRGGWRLGPHWGIANSSPPRQSQPACAARAEIRHIRQDIKPALYRDGGVALVVGRPAPVRSSSRSLASANFASLEVGYFSINVRSARRPWTLSLIS